MHCILVFDHLNDIIFSKCDDKFVKHIKKIEENNGLAGYEAENGADEVNINFVIQLFSPIVTSQRIMSSQFGNSYTSIQCQDGINMVFDEFMGYLFVALAPQEVHWLKRLLGICISIVQHLCGPDVSMLKMCKGRSALVRRLMDTWRTLVDRDQAVLVEAIEQLFVNPDVSTAAIKALKDSTDRIKSLLDYSRSHALLFVGNKFLALYSSKSVKELSIGDLLFLSLLAEMALTGDSEAAEVFSTPEASPSLTRKTPPSHPVLRPEDNVLSQLVLLSGGNTPAVIPYVVHVSTLAEGVSFVLLYQTQWDTLNLALNDAFSGVSLITSSTYNETEGAKRGMEILEAAMKKLLDSIKKIKAPDVSPKLDACIKVLHVKWDLLKKQWSEGQEQAVSSCAASLGLCLHDLLQSTTFDVTPIVRGHPAAQAIARCVHTAVSHFVDFLKVKAVANFTLGSRGSLSINKYLEEFPGLVHFLYVDRTNHRVTAPSLQLPDQPYTDLTKQKIWSMVEFSRLHLQEGHLTIMWRDTAFNYAYYLWFEDISGTPLKPKVSPSVAVKTLPIPGVFMTDFYKGLMEACFPKTSPSKVRCFELYCIHLGLATSSFVLEQSRRIAATICEVTGVPSNPLDLL